MSFNKNKGSPWVPAGMAATTVNPQVGAAVTGFGMAQNRMQKDTELKKPSPPQTGAKVNKWLFKFSGQEKKFGGSAEMGAAPNLLHYHEDGNMTGNHRTHINSDSFINVVETFPWHASKMDLTTTDTVPYVDMIEHDILANPMLNQIAANLSVGGDMTPDMIKDELQSVTSSFRNDDDEGAWTAIEAGLETSMLDTVENGETLLPYQNMYTTKPTGWRYIMPYFSSNHHQIANTFSTDKGETGSGMGSGLLQFGEELSETVANIAKGVSMNIVAPGQYIEKSKYYGFGGREKTYQFNFPISNTRRMGTLTESQTISRNWQLIFLLMYQNSPNRMSRDLVLPPCIYEAHIPGVWYSKYAYISSLNIEFLGTRRLMGVDFMSMRPGDAGMSGQNFENTIKAIIPEVYNITIGLTELVGESQNMLYHMSKGQDVITTGALKNNKDEWLIDD